jgi:hypothetical protein
VSASDQALWLIGLIVALGVCLTWAIFEIEAWRCRQRWRLEVFRAAMRSVAKSNRGR